MAWASMEAFRMISIVTGVGEAVFGDGVGDLPELGGRDAVTEESSK